MAAIDQPRDDRHAEGDVAAALKHREEDSRWLCHLRLVGSVSGLLLNSLGPNAALSGRGERTRASGPLQRDVRRLFACCEARTRHAIATVHSITRSARRRIDGGIVIPSAVAVLRLITSSNVVGCSTGISAGFAPFSILLTCSAAWRKTSEKFGP